MHVLFYFEKIVPGIFEICGKTEISFKQKSVRQFFYDCICQAPIAQTCAPIRGGRFLRKN